MRTILLILLSIAFCLCAEFYFDDDSVPVKYPRTVLYSPRLRLENTGQIWELWDTLYEDYCKFPSIAKCITLCSVNFPVDKQEALDRLSIQKIIFEDLVHSVLTMEDSIELATEILKMLEHRIFAFQDDFNQVLDGRTDSKTYRDVSFNVLIPSYNFLYLISDSKVTLAFHRVLDESHFTIRLFDLLISPDSRERTVVADIICRLLEVHPNLREPVLERMSEIMKLVQDSSFDHVHARSIIPVITIFQRYIEGFKFNNNVEEHLEKYFDVFQYGFLPLFHQVYFAEYMEEWRSAFFRFHPFVQMYQPGATEIFFNSAIVYLMSKTFTTTIPSFKMEEGQALFWLSTYTSRSLPTCHLKFITENIFRLVKSNPRFLITGLFCENVKDVISKFREPSFQERFQSIDYFFDCVELFLQEILLWVQSAYNSCNKNHLKSLRHVLTRVIPLYNYYKQYLDEQDDKAIRQTSIVNLYQEVSIYNFECLDLPSPTSRYHDVLQQANQRMRAEQSQTAEIFSPQHNDNRKIVL